MVLSNFLNGHFRWTDCFRNNIKLLLVLYNNVSASRIIDDNVFKSTRMFWRERVRKQERERLLMMSGPFFFMITFYFNVSSHSTCTDQQSGEGEKKKQKNLRTAIKKHHAEERHQLVCSQPFAIVNNYSIYK